MLRIAKFHKRVDNLMKILLSSKYLKVLKTLDRHLVAKNRIKERGESTDSYYKTIKRKGNEDD